MADAFICDYVRTPIGRYLATVLAEAEEAARVGGTGSEPSPPLVRLAQGGVSFAAWQENARDT